MKCKDCKRIAGGGAVCTFGNCEKCGEQVSSGCGSCPKLCKKCSKELNICEQCGIDCNKTK